MIPLYGSLIFCHLLADFVLPVKKLSQKGLTASAYSVIHVSLVILIFIFILIDQPLAVGFLIAAKSLLRIESDSKHHKRMEYILVGTLCSF